MTRTVCGVCGWDECRCKTHPGYVIGSHWLESAYSRICAGEDEAEVLRDYGWSRGDEVLREEVERLRSELAEAGTVRERCNERAFRLEAEVERLRDELRQGSIDITRAEVERLREALRAETARCSTICEEFAQRCRDAGWDDHAAVLRDAARQMQAGAEK